MSSPTVTTGDTPQIGTDENPLLSAVLAPNGSRLGYLARYDRYSGPRRD